MKPAAPPSVELARLVCQFNARPEVHPSWLADALPQQHGLRDEFLERPHLAAAHLGASFLGVQGSFDFDFHRRSKRIALLSSLDLNRLTTLCGLSLHGRDLRDTRAGELTAAIAKRVGASDLDFAIHRLAQAAPQASSRISPDCRPTFALSQIRRTGCSALLALLGRTSDAVTGRVRLKLPKPMAVVSVPSLSAAKIAGLKELFVLCIIPERLPQWDWLF